MKLLPTGIHNVPGAETDVFTVRSPNCVANATQGAIILKLAPAWATTHDGIVGETS